MKRHIVVRPDTTKDENVIGRDRDAVTHVIRDARMRAGLTQEKAAELTGHATSTISHWETGKLPKTWDDLAHYAHRLNQSIVLQFGPGSTKDPAPDWAQGLEERLTEVLLTNRRIFVQTMKDQLQGPAQFGVEQELGPPPPDEAAPGTPAAPPGREVRL